MSKVRKAIFWIVGFFIFAGVVTACSSNETTQSTKEELKQEQKDKKSKEEKKTERITVEVISHDKIEGKTFTDKTEYKVKTTPEATVTLKTKFIDEIIKEYKAKSDSKGIATFTVDTPRTEEGNETAYLIHIQAEKNGQKSEEIEALLTRLLTKEEEIAYNEGQAKLFDYKVFEKDPNNLELMTTRWKLSGTIQSKTVEGDYLVKVGGNIVLIMVPDSTVKKGLIKIGTNVDIVATGNGTYFEGGQEYIAMVAETIQVR